MSHPVSDRQVPGLLHPEQQLVLLFLVQHSQQPQGVEVLGFQYVQNGLGSQQPAAPSLSQPARGCATALAGRVGRVRGSADATGRTWMLMISADFKAVSSVLFSCQAGGRVPSSAAAASPLHALPMWAREVLASSLSADRSCGRFYGGIDEGPLQPSVPQR